jgi:hypothetical protein
MKAFRIILPAAALAGLLCSTFAGVGRAQIDPGGRIYLYENGIRSGEVYVPDRVAGQTQYTEHWVPYPNYLHPGPKFLGPMQVVPVTTEKPYASDAEFFKNVPFVKGSKYVRVDAEEFTSLPVAR